MKAIMQDRYGSADVLELRETDTPVAGDNDVLVRVRAASVNAYDWHFMAGEPRVVRLVFGRSGPKAKIRGRDFAGTVEAVGGSVTELRPGDEVYGEADGAFAEYISVPDSAVGPKPANLTFEQAAAMPLAANTALMGLHDVARVEQGQRVLINGASGGVGTFAVQLAKAFGAEVTGVCSTRNVDQTRSLGADHVIDYTREDFTRAGHRYDLVFDLAGNHSLTAYRRALTPTGTLVLSSGGPSDGSIIGPLRLVLKGRALSRFVRQRIVVLTTAPSKENLATLRDLAESGRLTPLIERTYPLSQAPEAILHVQQTHAHAKVIVTI